MALRETQHTAEADLFRQELVNLINLRHPLVQLAEHFGLSEATLSRLRGPIGIYIGSKTPPEIAVSVMAEVLAVQNGVVLPRDMAVAQAKNERAVMGNDAGALVCGVDRSSD